MPQPGEIAYRFTKYTDSVSYIFLRWRVGASLYNSNKLTNQMQQLHKFIT